MDGLYTGNPHSDPRAKRLEKIETINREIIDMAGGAGSSNGTGGMLTKIKAATIATESGVPVYICSSLKSDAMIEAAEKTKDGSYFVAQEKGLRTQNNGLPFMLRAKVLFGLIKGLLKLSLNMERVFSYLVLLKQKEPFLTVIS